MELDQDSGSKLADIMEAAKLLTNKKTIKQLLEIAESKLESDESKEWIKKGVFIEAFKEQCEELGYKLK